MSEEERKQIIFNAVGKYVDLDPHFGMKVAPLQKALHEQGVEISLEECARLIDDQVRLSTLFD